MRILQVAPPWLPVPPSSYGGIEWVVSGLADGLTEAGHEVTLLASGGSTTEARLQTVFDEPPFGQFGDTRIETIHALAAHARRGEYDLVHDHTAAVGPALGALGKGPPIVHTLHGAWNELETMLARLVAPPVRLVAISHDQAAGCPPEVPITAVIHNGIPLDRYPFVADKDDFLLFVGRSNREKGPAVAIEVARRLGRTLVLAIKVNEPYEHQYWDEVLAPLIGRSNPDIEVVMDPHHKEKVDLMGAASAVLFPVQWREPFGLVMPEANACGTPVVAFDLGSPREIVADGTSGFVVSHGDLEAFCTAVERTRELDPQGCRRHAAEHFSVERMVADYERLFETIVGEGGGPRSL